VKEEAGVAAKATSGDDSREEVEERSIKDAIEESRNLEGILA